MTSNSIVQDKEELIMKADQAIGNLMPIGSIPWARAKHPELLTKCKECDIMIDMQWDTLSYDQLKSILREKYNKFVFIKNLFERSV